VAAKRKKPPVQTLEQEALAFSNKLKKSPVDPPKILSPQRVELAASALSGLLASGSRARAEELLEEAFRYADLLLQYKD
tara:strand:- start:4416 stop:4652 length:237 start_codon:yes stop_codon:yes gene_type:complete